MLAPTVVAGETVAAVRHTTPDATAVLEAQIAGLREVSDLLRRQLDDTRTRGSRSLARPGRVGAAAAHRPGASVLVATDGRRVTILQVELPLCVSTVPALASCSSRQLVSTSVFSSHSGLSLALKPLKYFGAYLFCRQVTLAATIRRARTLAGLCNADRQALLG
jgi:hypothetical protein